MEILSNGKIPSKLLASLLAQLPTEGLVIPPSIGVDACVAQCAELISVKADPITMSKTDCG